MSVWKESKRYAVVLGETVLTCSRFSAHWVTMDNKDFVVAPFNMLPSEEAKDSAPEKVEKEKKAIRNLILHKSNWEVSQNPKAMKLLGALGSDLIVNTPTYNFRLLDGALNDDVEEANNLNRQIINRLSISSPNKLPAGVLFFLTSTEFLQHEYGTVQPISRNTLGLTRNVKMSSFPIEKNFTANLAKIFEDVAKEVAYCRKRVSVDGADHSFVMQGTNKLYLAIVYKPLFYEAGNYQLIITAEIPDEAMKRYVEARKMYPETPFVLKARKVKLPDILDKGAFTAKINNGDGLGLIKEVEVTNVHILKQRDLHAKYCDSGYPASYIPFYLYDAPDQAHIDHMLPHTPNIQLSADNVTFNPPLTSLGNDLEKGTILYVEGVSEISMQPFGTAGLKKPNFFRRGKTFNVSIYKDPKAANAVGPGLSKVATEPIATGKIALIDNIYVDTEWVNSDPFSVKEMTEGLQLWKSKIDKGFP